ncbi:Iron transport multicopper oxidase FET3 [Penicillium rolfsii]|nr:Iron transport multicopper oxidase FET3 [Penicillium rolfsii]
MALASSRSEKGDRVVVCVTNDLEDNPLMVTEYPVALGLGVLSNFTVNQHGTYRYHCHSDYYCPDGYRAPFIVHNKSSSFTEKNEEEVTVTMSDWNHTVAEDIKCEFMPVYYSTGAEQIPNSFLFNNPISQSYPVQAVHHFAHLKNSTEKNYGMVIVADPSLLDTNLSDLLLKQVKWLEYDSNAAHSNVSLNVSDSSEYYFFFDISLVPHDGVELYKNPKRTVEVTLQKLHTVNYTSDLQNDTIVHGDYGHSIVLDKDELVEVILIRFVAIPPGVWLSHSRIDWHMI